MPPPDEEIDQIQAALKRLVPQPPTFSRDALLFAAGQASAVGRIPSWFWPSVSGFLTCVCFVLTAFLVSPTEMPRRIEAAPVVVQRDFPRPAPPVVKPSPIQSSMTPQPEPVSTPTDAIEASERKRLWQLRRDVIRWGVDMIPDSSRQIADTTPSKPTPVPMIVSPPTFAIPGLVKPKKRMYPDFDLEELD